MINLLIFSYVDDILHAFYVCVNACCTQRPEEDTGTQELELQLPWGY